MANPDTNEPIALSEELQTDLLNGVYPMQKAFCDAFKLRLSMDVGEDYGMGQIISVSTEPHLETSVTHDSVDIIRRDYVRVLGRWVSRATVPINFENELVCIGFEGAKCVLIARTEEIKQESLKLFEISETTEEPYQRFEFNDPKKWLQTYSRIVGQDTRSECKSQAYDHVIAIAADRAILSVMSSVSKIVRTDRKKNLRGQRKVFGKVSDQGL